MVNHHNVYSDLPGEATRQLSLGVNGQAELTGHRIMSSNEAYGTSFQPSKDFYDNLHSDQQQQQQQQLRDFQNHRAYNQRTNNHVSTTFK